MRGVAGLVFLLLYAPVFGQKVTATPSAQSILIGEPFTIRLQANFDKSETVQWFEIDTITHFETLERSTLDTLHLEGNLALTQTLTVTSWDSGRWQMPAFTLGRFRTKPFLINVNYSTPFDPTQPYHDIKDIIDVKKPVMSNWQWYLIFALVLIALFILFFPSTKKPPPSAFVEDTNIFKQSLTQLEALGSRPVADPKVFYTEMISIFRNYLLKRKNIESFSKTSDDLGIRVNPFFNDQDAFTKLMQTLRLADHVKFARLEPTQEENREALEHITATVVTIENSAHVV